jgi:lysophospholipid hydrolase
LCLAFYLTFQLFVTVILTRFSRVTFNAAHKYLGLTTEVLRTEKAINDIACHPLPASFYEGGGLQYLRQRFDKGGKNPPDAEGEYFKRVVLPTNAKATFTPILPKFNLTDNPIPVLSPSPVEKRGHFKRQTSRHYIQAGDLHTSDTYGPLTRRLSVSTTPIIPRLSDKDYATRLSGDEFDLREEVMSCIAKSIGLLQPPLSGTDSVEFSPAFSATEGGQSSNRGFNSSFGSLSLLEIGDDTSSMGGSSIVSTSYMSGLDNEVEVLFFAAGSLLAKAGERNTGGFSVD